MSSLGPSRRVLVDVLDLAQLAGDAVVAVALTAITVLLPSTPAREPGAATRRRAVP